MTVTIDDDFDLDRIAQSGQCFRWESLPGGAYRIPFRSHCLHIAPLGGEGYELDCTAEEWEGVWKRYFALDENYRAIRAQADPGEDPFLWRACEAQKGLRILRQDPWEVTVSFIISQNRNIPAIKRSVELLCQSCGERLSDRRGGSYYAFPSPEGVAGLSDGDLAACRLGYRDRYVRAAALAACSGALDFDALAGDTEEDAMKALLGLYGVGVKVASCIALFGLHRLNAFPIDTWMRRALAAEYPGGYPFERYSPWNGVFQQYIFAYYRSGGREPPRDKMQ